MLNRSNQGKQPFASVSLFAPIMSVSRATGALVKLSKGPVCIAFMVFAGIVLGCAYLVFSYGVGLDRGRSLGFSAIVGLVIAGIVALVVLLFS